MIESKLSKLLLVFLVAVLLNHQVQGQSNRVSSKLDFDDADNPNNSSVPIVPGVGQGRTDDQNTGGMNSASGVGGGATSTTSGGGGKSGPKIHGVRVTVDTGDTQHSKESKESVEITDVGKNKKRVGIHTDITFEITADGDEEANVTSSAQRPDKEDASVPIYKGRGGTTHKPRKPYDPKSQHWNPNFSSERRGYDSIGRGGSSYGGHYPQYPHNVPVYTGAGDSRGGSGSVYRSGDNGWNNYVPIASVWTTERTSYSEPYRPNAVTGHRSPPSWKPCYCISSTADNRRRRESHHGFGFMRPTGSVIQVVDGKLERPFS